jgi:FG-GAP-like repeat
MPMFRKTILPSFIANLALALFILCESRLATADPPRFRKLVLTDKYFCDGINTGDFNRDGKPDVVAGPFWYEGPAFKVRHEFYPARPFPTEPSPTNSMYSYVWDFNGDGWPDILVLGRVHKHEAFWYENPRGKRGYWKKHFAFHRVKGESPPFLDVDVDGRPELVAHWNGSWGLIQPNWKEPTRPWTFRPITKPAEWPQFYHGTGVGDVNGDGRLDLVLNDGWWEQPPKGSRQKYWTEHRFKFSPKRGGAQMFVYDVNGDGRNDVITALDAHGWGLAWFEQVKTGGRITFRRHTIMGSRDEEKRYGVAFSQPHALALADIDGDGLQDVVVGKRRWAHGPKGDIEPNAPPVLYWFRLVRRKNAPPVFEPRLIDARSGVGVQVTVADVNGDGAADVLTVSKLGTFVFLQSARKK